MVPLADLCSYLLLFAVILFYWRGRGRSFSRVSGGATRELSTQLLPLPTPFLKLSLLEATSVCHGFLFSFFFASKKSEQATNLEKKDQLALQLFRKKTLEGEGGV
eukprot:TRINITY_DN3037_c0_g1_i1.p1 TRINITY_DN3037_c0_g1~~TRINITY_DN3037_c0_g1_i1.p1  ORF type:complete len:105 (-),score=1.54 TRINITY_DN3037_c0_g1_i1:74-388(-)